MKTFKFNFYKIIGNEWKIQPFNPKARLISLYDDNFKFYGIGMY